MGVYERHCCVSYGTVDSWCAVKQSLRGLLQLSCFYVPTHNGLVPNVYDKRGLGKGKSQCLGAMLLRYFCNALQYALQTYDAKKCRVHRSPLALAAITRFKASLVPRPQCTVNGTQSIKLYAKLRFFHAGKVYKAHKHILPIKRGWSFPQPHTKVGLGKCCQAAWQYDQVAPA